MRRYPLPVVVAGVAAGFAAGLVTAWWAAPAARDVPPSTAAATSPRPPAVPSPFGRPGDAGGRPAAAVVADAPVVAVAAAPVANAGQPLDEHGLRERARRDPVFLRKLLDRLDTETDPEARDQLKSVLGTMDQPEALAAFRKLAQSSDVARRRDAYDLLRHAPDSAEARAILRQALASEQTPEALVQAVAALRPGPVEPSEAEAITAQLRALTQHADASVRAQSVTQLAQWDRTGEGGPRYAQALADAAMPVRQAAVFAIAQSGARDPAAKSALLAIAQSGTENRELRGSALQVLDRFALTREEAAAVQQARQRLAQ